MESSMKTKKIRYIPTSVPSIQETLNLAHNVKKGDPDGKSISSLKDNS